MKKQSIAVMIAMILATSWCMAQEKINPTGPQAKHHHLKKSTSVGNSVLLARVDPGRQPTGPAAKNSKDLGPGKRPAFKRVVAIERPALMGPQAKNNPYRRMNMRETAVLSTRRQLPKE